jgi:formylglycine-generating enzyme required for sulfatase activity
MPGDELDTAGSVGRRGFDPAASAGLFVGVSTFEDERIIEVPYAVDDAVDLAHLFALELGLVAPACTTLLLAGAPQKDESLVRLEALRKRGARFATARQRDIYRHLAELIESVRSGGMALLSVATHGVSDAGGDFLVAMDSLADRKLRTGVAVAEVFEEASRAGRGLVLLDACREQVLRARGEGAGATAMGEGFAEAIAKARGLVVLSGATLGGFAYDDPKRRNGVFTAAVLDGLHGGAAPGPGGWITVGTLAQFVQEQVVAWVRREWPGHAERSLGIGKRIEASAEGLPLAPHPSSTRVRERYRERRTNALARVRELQGKVLSATHWEQVRALLPLEEPNAEAERLLEEIEALDGSVRSQRGVRDYLRELEGEMVGVSQPLKLLEPEPNGNSFPTNLWATKKLQLTKTLTLAVVATAVGFGSFLGLPFLIQRFGQADLSGATIDPGQPAAGTQQKNSFGMGFLYVPSGTYPVGSPQGVGESNEGRHEVTFRRGFWIGETEVTQAQWARLVPKESPWAFKSCGSDCPVDSVSWYAAAEFADRLSKAEKLKPCYDLKGCKGTLGGDYTCLDPPPPDLDCPGYRLPTESEWEVAARAGKPNAEVSDLALDAWYDRTSGGSVHPVGKKQSNPWGFHDMLGNIREWTSDWYVADPTGQAVDARDPAKDSTRVIRGGSWFSSALSVRAAFRYGIAPSYRWRDLGFRLARSQSLRASTGE